MEGIQYIVDERGKRKAAIIDLRIYAKIWDDIHDVLVIESRAHEPRISWEEVKRKRHDGKKRET